MAPVIPYFLFIFIPILAVLGCLIFLWLRGMKLKLKFRHSGFITLIFSVMIVSSLGLVTYSLVNNEDQQRNRFVGNYMLADTGVTKKIILIITESNYSISSENYTDCITGTWNPILMDDGYIIDFSCPNGKSLNQLQLINNELVSLSEELRFIKTEFYK